jgi:hypothetical protein
VRGRDGHEEGQVGPIPDRIDLAPETAITAVDDRPPLTEHQHRTIARWVYGGAGIGIVLGYVMTGLFVAVLGWSVLTFLIVWNLSTFPCICALIGLNICPALPRDRAWRWKPPGRPRIHTQTLMILIAYVALLCGMGVSAGRLGTARQYHSKSIGYASLATAYRKTWQTFETGASQNLRAAALLRSGKIPETLHPSQKEYLRSLDGAATPEDRKSRYESIAETGEWSGKWDERNAVVYRRLTEYYEALAAKYDRASRRPLRPVAPDPPMPPTQ